MRHFGLVSATAVITCCLSVRSSSGPFVGCTESPPPAEGPADVSGLAAVVIGRIVGSWEIVDGRTAAAAAADGDGLPLEWLVKRKERTLVANIRDVVSALHNGTGADRSGAATTLASVENLRPVAPRTVGELLECVDSLERGFDALKQIIYGGQNKNESVNLSYSSKSLEQFSATMLNSSRSPHEKLAKVHSLIVSELKDLQYHTHAGIFNIIKHTIENSKILLCDQKQSLQQLIFNLHTILHHTQLKGFSVMQFSWMLLQLYGKGNFTLKQGEEINDLKKNVNEQLKILKKSMSSANNVYWKCDPKKHVYGTTYSEITKLLQGYIENEINMNQEQSCRKKCNDFEVVEHKSCVKDSFCKNQRACNGPLYNCQSFDSNMKICQSELGSNRRYEYISYKNGITFGDSSTGCKSSINKINNWRNFFLFMCSYCFCICDSFDPNSDRYFSLKPSLSDIDLNKVVTGLRFIKVNQMFHLQVQEGRISSQGFISELTRKWVPLSTELIYRNSTLINGIDYHRLTFTNRTIDLDNVLAPKNMVITGVKFRMLGSHLNIVVRVTPYNFMNGNLSVSQSYWIGNDNTELSKIQRLEIDIDNSDLPIKASSTSEPDMASNKFIKFTHSSINHDVAQTTLPFIDIQPVTPSKGIPLSGVGIYFKGSNNYAGFIGTSVFTYNFTDYLNLNL